MFLVHKRLNIRYKIKKLLFQQKISAKTFTNGRNCNIIRTQKYYAIIAELNIYYIGEDCMRDLKSKLIIIAVIVSLTIIAMITSVYAANEKIEIITKDGEYIIYVNDYERTSFKFAFSTEELTAEQANLQLTFINSCQDVNGQQAAFLDNTMDIYNEETIFMYAKTLEGETILTAESIIKEQALSDETLAEIENITKRIPVETSNTTQTAEDIDGVAVTKTFGQIDIIPDDTNAIYYYELIKIDDTVSEDAKTLMEMLKNLPTILEESDVDSQMNTKISIMKQINEKYTKLINTAEWKKVSNMQVVQPLTTVDGDQYIALLKKDAEGGETIYDAQFLTSEREDSNKFEPIIEEREVKVSLPVTYDSILLFVILIVIVAIITIVLIRIKMLEKKENENK